MPTHKTQEKKNVSYFVTFACYKWKHLIDEGNTYASFYRWFEYLKTIEVKTLGYVIMPNHFHGIFFVPDECPKTINQILSNGKRFIAYEIVDGLKINGAEDTLQELRSSVSKRDEQSGKKHKVFRTSSDCKEIFNDKMLLTKLEYIHRNPCQNHWNLVDDFVKYPHSSAAYYELGEANKWITDYRELG